LHVVGLITLIVTDPLMLYQGHVEMLVQ